ncbi:Predicted phosphohydrolase or phosphomutase, AlkP superfamily [Halobiforma haloterrestris]|uniref:Predicted phosphohydrolase or phosphomutase, AlkP superfamily n=1 Tax=Natronobacterium haloterrestre TaxID=148448 RepID=A0A1I1F2C0_NATHA|nr:alkaline phosphatase family protein [Halobiforma haloterrestris]SFB93082.1 Predicted phosphohydrolase or phosphomutase, AlkP superfamily [Halobiforma haloterrestris]
MDDRSSLRTLLVGIDAACERVLEPLVADGEVPTLESLIDDPDAASGPLESQIPPWTASAWPSLYTGKNPGKHGVYGFLSFDGYDWDVVNATDVRERALWELLSDRGLTSVVVNVPVTHPPREFDGALIPGYTAPEDPDCHPGGLLDDVREAIGEYRVYPDEDGDRAETYSDCARMRGEAFRYLADRYEPEFGFLEFQVTDSIFHKEPDNDAAIREIYREVDRQVEAILEEHDPDNVILTSDHGMGPYDGQEFRINEFLRDEGLVETERGGSGMPTWATVRDDSLKQGEDRTDRDPGLGERAMASAARLGLTSQRIGAVLRRFGLGEVVASYAPTGLVNAGATQVDFESSRAYVRSRIELGVRINLEGREPDGVVPPAEYEAVRTRVIDALRSVRTPEGERVFETVAPREEFFHGPETDDAVDVVAVPAEFDHFLSATLRGDWFGPPAEPWNHKLEGIVAARGADVDEAAGIGDAHLFDVAPTVLATLDVPIDDRMDGTPLPCVDPSGYRSYPRLDDDRSVATADDAVEDRLADLGYLE